MDDPAFRPPLRQQIEQTPGLNVLCDYDGGQQRDAQAGQRRVVEQLNIVRHEPGMVPHRGRGAIDMMQRPGMVTMRRTEIQAGP